MLSELAAVAFEAGVDHEDGGAAGLGVDRAHRNGVARICAGSFMVSYATAKAEAMQVSAPRGSMRRVERAAVLATGAALALLAAMAPRVAILGLTEVPVITALVIVAVVANASAVRRLRRVAEAAQAVERSDER